MLTKKTRIFQKASRPRKKPVEARKRPSQLRSQETVAAIEEAAARILESGGLSGYNTNAIAARAGVSIGSLYQYFPNKDALTVSLIAKFEEQLKDAVSIATTREGPEGLAPRLRRIVRALLAVHHRRAAFHRALEQEEERLQQISKAFGPLTNQLLKILREHRDELAIAPTKVVVLDAITVTRAVMDAALLNKSGMRETEHRVMRALCGYLFYRATL